MTPIQWIMLIQLCLQLWQQINDAKATDEAKAKSVGTAVDTLVPLLKPKEAEQIKAIVGKDNENIPMLMGLLSNLGEIFKK